ncbi:MAG: PIN domain protein [Clostridia bacterium]|jgi:hypothetical protein
MLVYLDNCVFNRPFDDQGQLLISLQTQAKLAIQERIRQGSLQLAWSYILDYENVANPYEARRGFVATWKAYSVLDLEESDRIISWSEELAKKGFVQRMPCTLPARVRQNAPFLSPRIDVY